MTLIKLDFSLIKDIKGRPKLLLMPPIPLPLHTVNPRNIMGEKWWNRVRKIAYSTNEHHCWACGAFGERLEAHESYMIDYDEHFMVLDKVIALCHKCHMFVHLGFWHSQLCLKKITNEEYTEVYMHGLEVLEKDNLLPMYDKMKGNFLSAEDLHRDWNKWYLLYDNVKHYSPFKDWNAWDKHWRGKDK